MQKVQCRKYNAESTKEKVQRTKEMAQGTHLRFSSYGGQAGHRVHVQRTKDKGNGTGLRAQGTEYMYKGQRKGESVERKRLRAQSSGHRVKSVEKHQVFSIQ